MASNASDKDVTTSDKVIKYVADHSIRITPVQKSLLDMTEKHPHGFMLEGPEVLQLTSNLIKTIGAKKVLDIGVFTGSSTLSAALALPENGEVHSLDVSEEFVNLGKPYFAQAQVEKKIHIHIAPALETLDKMISQGLSGTFDFAYIDADKGNYINYYERCLVLLRKGGIIAVDNTIWYGKVADETVNDPSTLAIRAFNDLVKDDQRVDISFLTIGDGLTLLFIR